ncbi:MAG: hypothetical protein IT238_08595 [Bacteroidia bacterium]|nr:hypothetical protein [Bacteroidia bacterium]MCZ2248649.1 hypothetical protein [Bacteroidia bacterium]
MIVSNNSLWQLALYKRIFLIIPFVLFSLISKAQLYNFKSFSLEEGLAQSEVNCIFQDSRGYIWVGTSGGGICRFDGKEFITFDSENGLGGQIVTGIAEDKNGNLWIGATWGGLSKFDGKKFTIYNKGLPSSYITKIYIDKQGKIYAGTIAGISYLKDGKFVSIKQELKAKIKISGIKQDKQGKIWVASDKGLFTLEDNTLKSINNATREGIVAFDIDTNNRINLILESNKIFLQQIKADGTLNTAENISSDLPTVHADDHYNNIYIDRLNRRWITTSTSGLFCQESDGYFHYSTKNGLQSNKTISVYQDSHNTMWIGTRGFGLIKFKDRSFTYFDNINGLNQEEVFSMAVDNDNNLWFGSNFLGVLKYDGKRVINYKEDPLIRTLHLQSICVLQDKRILFGGSRGLVVYDGNSFKRLPGVPEEPRLRISTIFQSQNGDIWVGTSGQGVYKYRNGKLISVIDAKKLYQINIYSICQIKDEIYVGTAVGVWVIKDDDFSFLDNNKSFCNSYIGSMAVDKFNRLWIGTDKCISFWDGKKFVNYGVKSGLSASTIYSVICDKDGNIWAGTNKGIDKLSFDEKGALLNIKSYGLNEGFKGIECNSRSVAMNKEGEIYFGTVKGIIKYNSLLEIPQNSKDILQIESFKVNFNEYVNTQEEYKDYWYRLALNPKLPYGTDRVSFSFYAINPSNPYKKKYSYILEGVDNEWSPWSQLNIASYSNLSPGKYTLKVKSINNNNLESNIVEYPFEIKTPIYMNIWVILLVSAIAGYLYYFYNKYKKKLALKDLEKLEYIIAERTYQIQKQNEEKEILLKEVHHRVKNNLQVINSLINIQATYIEDKKALHVFEECKNRIRTISLIHERLYKSKDFKKINLKEYIIILIQDLIKIYNIDKEIELKTELQTEYFNLNTLVPLGLLLNEIVSNSLKYAFVDLKKGEISIRLTEKGYNVYEMTIGDNGRGFDINPNNTENNTLGLELIKVLSAQLDGFVEKLNVSGTVYRLSFKLQKN